MIRHKNGKNKPLYIGGQKYDGSKTVVVELAPDKSEYKNFFLTYIAGYDEYKLVFCPVDLENIVPLETHIYSDEDCTVEIALITEIVEGTNDVKVLYPDGKQAIFLFSNTKETNGLVDFETMKDYVADYVEEHGGGGGGAIEQPLNLKQSPVSEFVPYNGTTPVYFETNTAYTKLFENVREDEDETKENYSKLWQIFSFSKSDLKDENENISFILKFCITEYGDGVEQFEMKLIINIGEQTYSVIYNNKFALLSTSVQSFISVYRDSDFRYCVALKKIRRSQSDVIIPGAQRLYSLYGSINVRKDNLYTEDFSNIDFFENRNFILTTPSGDNNHFTYTQLGAHWIDADFLDDFVLRVGRYYSLSDIETLKEMGGAWFYNKILMPNYVNPFNYLCSLYLIGDFNYREGFGRYFAGFTNYVIEPSQSGFDDENLNYLYANCDKAKVIKIRDIYPKRINGAFTNCSQLEEIIGSIYLNELVEMPETFLSENVKYVEINRMPANSVFTNTLFKTWANISWVSTAEMLRLASGGAIELHVTRAQYDRLLSEAIADPYWGQINNEEGFIFTLQDELFTTLIIDE